MKVKRRTHWLSALLTLVLVLMLLPTLSQPARVIDPETWNGKAVTMEKVYYMDPYDPTKLIYDYKYFTAMFEEWNQACAGYPIKLTKDWLLYYMTNNTPDIYLEVPEGKSVTLYLNGYTVNRRLEGVLYQNLKQYGGVAYLKYASLTMETAPSKTAAESQKTPV